MNFFKEVLKMPFVVVSGDKPSLTEEQKKINREQIQYFASKNGYNYVSCSGVYEGQSEYSFLIYGKGNKNSHSLAELGEMIRFAYNQDSFLIYDGVLGYLDFGNGPRALGPMRFEGNSHEPHTALPDGTRFFF